MDDVPPELEGKEIDIIQTGNWWIAELTDIGIATQGESREEALDKLRIRLEKYERRRNREPPEPVSLPDPRLPDE